VSATEPTVRCLKPLDFDGVVTELVGWMKDQKDEKGSQLPDLTKATDRRLVAVRDFAEEANTACKALFAMAQNLPRGLQSGYALEFAVCKSAVMKPSVWQAAVPAGRCLSIRLDPEAWALDYPELITKRFIAPREASVRRCTCSARR
jgi:hypothetical protein